MKKTVSKKTPSKYSLLQDELLASNKDFFAKAEAKRVFDAISHGQNSYLRINRIETSVFDNEWIKRIEETIPELENIVRNPRRTTQTVGNVVPVELARKTNSDSVRHLATHTQFVKEIKDNGDVIPSKVLSIGTDDQFNTYENRFIATLIRRLVLFVEKRYEYIIEHALLKDVEELKMKSKSVVDGSVVEMETKVKIVKPADYDGVEEKNRFVQRVIQVRDHLRYCYTSSFMKMLKTEKNVRNPVLMTNIIRKNLRYHKCYLLWRYIEGYTLAGVNYSVEDKFMKFDAKALKEANMALVSSFLAVRPGKPSSFAFEKTKTYKPKILTSIDDEEFIYGPYLQGPVEFVRVDDAYRKATEVPNEFFREEDVYGKSSRYVPMKEKIIGFMKKEEEEFIAEERLENRSIHLMREAKDQLYNRKRRENIAFDRKAISIIQQREKEEKALRIKLSEEERLRQLMLAKIARRKLIDEAKDDANNNEYIKSILEAPVVEEDIIDENDKVIIENDIDISDSETPIQNFEENNAESFDNQSAESAVSEPKVEENVTENPIAEITDEQDTSMDIEEQAAPISISEQTEDDVYKSENEEDATENENIEENVEAKLPPIDLQQLRYSFKQYKMKKTKKVKNRR